MTDKYTQFVSHGIGKDLAKKLGLPQPAVLRRYKEGEPLVPGPVLVLGSGNGRTAGSDDLAAALAGWGLDVRRSALPKEKLGAIVLVLDAVEHPEELAGPVLTAAPSLRDLAPARGWSRSPAPPRPLPPGCCRRPSRRRRAAAFARQGTPGGCHGQRHSPRDGAGTTSPSTLGALRFFLSGRSAFVDGQFLTVTSGAGQLSADPDKPWPGRSPS
ncbi:3-Ketoacyl-(Acyl-Carrier-Protein) reductase [Arthrobacter sp. Hiyo8]|nr:3-Ketoacyl-(Acyl-Carrier-Protein) reductase [Arthrobacter sp. Hiyo8]